ncbi:tellurite resistance TerB family protein [Falsirhodobacter sp. 20TX0035]|uniref:tellurite resistance TerB family protein n=1 Tax=Falsirhodobacter sp. 20TX0035 TaxID=3022019 RepID=UPI002331240D|nr:hypothetical protein [Falsirhodobacter sp. 20TX0035]MDB6454474.1 hypothetical protein [Falsirhodobacter sp. 20TX0035]
MVKLLDWIFARAAHPDIDFRKLDTNGSVTLTVTLTAEDLKDLDEEDLDFEDHDDFAPEMPLPQKVPAGRQLENLFCYIEYRDAKRNLTRRPITMLTLKGEGADVGIFAVCHLRKSTRLFRCDRIENVITSDGEITEGRAFLRDILNVDIAPAPILDAAVALPTFRSQIMSPLTVLVAAAKADGDYDIHEIDSIVSYAEREAMRLHMAGLVSDDMTIEASDALCTAVRNMRPQARSLERHIMNVLTLPEDARRRFKKALEAVIVADGHIHDRETEFWVDFDALAQKAGHDPMEAWDVIQSAARRAAESRA